MHRWTRKTALTGAHPQTCMWMHIAENKCTQIHTYIYAYIYIYLQTDVWLEIISHQSVWLNGQLFGSEQVNKQVGSMSDKYRDKFFTRKKWWITNCIISYSFNERKNFILWVFSNWPNSFPYFLFLPSSQSDRNRVFVLRNANLAYFWSNFQSINQI